MLLARNAALAVWSAMMRLDDETILQRAQWVTLHWQSANNNIHWCGYDRHWPDAVLKTRPSFQKSSALICPKMHEPRHTSLWEHNIGVETQTSHKPRSYRPSCWCNDSGREVTTAVAYPPSPLPSILFSLLHHVRTSNSAYHTILISLHCELWPNWHLLRDIKW